jgi:hypothetical protein
MIAVRGPAAGRSCPASLHDQGRYVGDLLADGMRRVTGSADTVHASTTTLTVVKDR